MDCVRYGNDAVVSSDHWDDMTAGTEPVQYAYHAGESIVPSCSLIVF